MAVERGTSSWTMGGGEGDELVWTRKFCGGIRRDIKARCPYFVSDWTDAFKGDNCAQTTASISFLFFACLAPAIAFGTIYQDSTDKNLGVLECILASALAGIAYSIGSGQPLCILGATGPKLAYMVAFYQLCQSMDVDFLTARVWMGMWCSLFVVIFAITDSSALMAHATRYMEEIFSAFISLIFIIEAFIAIFSSFDKLGREAGFCNVILGFGTFYLAIMLKGVKGSKLFNGTMRNLIGNFAVTISILIITVCARAWASDVNIEWLDVPDKVEPTLVLADGNECGTATRSWVISPFGQQCLNDDGLKRAMPSWMIFFSAIPGLGMALLNYLDQNLTTLLINRPSNHLKKPVGYHLDMLVLGAVVMPPCALLGLPFPCAATVRSVTHLISLSSYEERPIPGGGFQKVVSHVIEQRWTNFGIHFVMLMSLFAAPVLRNVPKSVLFGVFLYMGVTSMVGIQLFDRLWLWFNFNPETYPRLPYVTRTTTSRLHLFTAIQVLMLGILYGLKSIKQTAVAFPFFIALLVPFRTLVLPKIFTAEELDCLDNHDDLPPDPATTVEAKITAPALHRSWTAMHGGATTKTKTKTKTNIPVALKDVDEPSPADGHLPGIPVHDDERADGPMAGA